MPPLLTSSLPASFPKGHPSFKRWTIIAWKTIGIILAGCSLFIAANSFAADSPGRFVDIFEPSGIEQSGPVTLIIEDEKEQPLHILTGFSRQGTPQTKVLRNCGTALDDLEAITSDGDFFYLAGSHQVKADGSRRKKRELFVRLKVKDDGCEESAAAPSLYRQLEAALASFDGTDFLPPQINIEALAWKHDSAHLYIGLRQPLIKGRSVLLLLENPRELFAEGTTPIISREPVFLALDGGGIRAMSYIEDLGGYLIANETQNEDGRQHSRLWFWKGEASAAVEISLPAFNELKNIEGLSSFRYNNQSGIIFVCDDGGRKKKKGGHFTVIPTADLMGRLD